HLEVAADLVALRGGLGGGVGGRGGGVVVNGQRLKAGVRGDARALNPLPQLAQFGFLRIQPGTQVVVRRSALILLCSVLLAGVLLPRVLLAGIWLRGVLLRKDRAGWRRKSQQ